MIIVNEKNEQKSKKIYFGLIENFIIIICCIIILIIGSIAITIKYIENIALLEKIVPIISISLPMIIALAMIAFTFYEIKSKIKSKT